METLAGRDGRPRCAWCAATTTYEAYHDTEWGFPVSDDRRLFEKICLEGFQAGLSWRTILEKRETFREAFFGFDPERVARFNENDVERLLQNPGIIRHRGKIEATINNARRMPELLEREGSLASYIWRFEPPRRDVPEVVTATPASVALSKDLKKRGWRFVGPTTAYAFMQAMGLVNDHATGCAMRADAEAARARFIVPTR
ncbi:DNA-3-methyladenine glycosylase I [Acetobacter conturbans]|uniref:DNA-3-methyladenine glycosylase I n=1 Tax=Acetobacter conturbans TaxID=1737472 RepID=A0ABX0JZD8_9PROT|nr:DNA-3-methyladenine glycosylase I [Acetobacter conturbans]NHN88703.1 DNA-3-methyladenine glycosylase I [Acetobacter conturbans]